MGLEGIYQAQDSPEFLLRSKDLAPVLGQWNCQNLEDLWRFQKGQDIGHNISTHCENGRVVLLEVSALACASNAGSFFHSNLGQFAVVLLLLSGRLLGVSAGIR
jgi:hypothetical protein